MAAGAFRVIIDPGHGGRDLGAKGINRVKEKDLTLVIALKLAQRIGKDPSIKVFLTRRDDRFIPLGERASFARKKRGDIFISLHFNASFDNRASGVRIFYMDFDFRRRETEKEGSTSAEDDLKAILSDLKRTESINESARLAAALNKELRGTFSPKGGRIFQTRPGVLIPLDIPAVLVELGFLTNPQDLKRVTDPKGRRRIVEGIYRGIVRFLGLKDQQKSGK